jgi:hypothetical protein
MLVVPFLSQITHIMVYFDYKRSYNSQNEVDLKVSYGTIRLENHMKSAACKMPYMYGTTLTKLLCHILTDLD